MKTTKLTIFGAIFIILAFAMVSATVTQNQEIKYGVIETDGSLTTTNTVIPTAQSIGFVCENTDCSVINRTLFDIKTADSNGKMTLTFPTTLQNGGYGLFFFKDSYIPFEVKSTFSGSGSAPTGIRYLTQKRSCTSTLTNVLVNSNDNTINADLTVHSPIQNAGPLNIIPSQITSQYSADVEVTFTAVGPTNYTETKKVNLAYSSQQEISFSFTGQPGNYQTTISTNASDSKCLSSVIQNAVNSVTLQGTNGTDNNNSSDITIEILSPENITYNTNDILLNVNAVNSTLIKFSLNNGELQIYTLPMFINAQNGSNTLTVFASNNLTSAEKTVVFSVVSNSGNQTNTTDTIAPGPISNLRLTSSSTSSLSWSWTNPSDSDFSGVIIYFDGINVQNSTGNTFTASGLDSDTTHTITIKTIDTSGNINNNAVSDTQTTDSSSNNNGESSKSRRSSIQNVSCSGCSQIVKKNIVDDYGNDMIALNPQTKKATQVNWLIINLLLILFIILVAVVVIMLSRR